MGYTPCKAVFDRRIHPIIDRTKENVKFFLFKTRKPHFSNPTRISHPKRVNEGGFSLIHSFLLSVSLSPVRPFETSET
ncbi:hypothetical protein RJT34_33197 [Clitoria ternatea]|uniref:Uncharacterized protein n=1 Tax=Clitoria ternatea TaxID=43366 RepID=A0AAN9EZP6_CLITE